MKCTIAVPLIILLGVVGSMGQAKKTNRTSTALETTRVWHRDLIKDEFEGDRVVYYLPSVEDANVLLTVVCGNGKKAAFTSLNFPFALCGTGTIPFDTGCEGHS
jgi:hypothetical protein